MWMTCVCRVNVFWNFGTNCSRTRLGFCSTPHQRLREKTSVCLLKFFLFVFTCFTSLSAMSSTLCVYPLDAGCFHCRLTNTLSVRTAVRLIGSEVWDTLSLSLCIVVFLDFTSVFRVVSSQLFLDLVFILFLSRLCWLCFILLLLSYNFEYLTWPFYLYFQQQHKQPSFFISIIINLSRCTTFLSLKCIFYCFLFLPAEKFSFWRNRAVSSDWLN